MASRLGEAFVEISARMDKLEKSLSKAQADVNKAVTGMDNSVKGAERSINSLGNSIKLFYSTIVAYGLGQVAKGFLETASSFEQLNTSLKTVTGSSAEAKRAMDWIVEFTAKTPYELQQVGDAFRKLAAYGLEPRNVMKMLGDTASAMGKDLNMAVEMWTDAITGEFERLKEFGVKAKTEEDKIKFSFSSGGKDMVIEAKKTASGISDALSQIFKKFDGGMEEQSKTWKGTMSNMNDAWTLFKKEVMDSEGLFAVMKTGATELLNEVLRLKSEGKLKEWAKDTALAVIDAFKAMVKGAEILFVTINNIRASMMGLSIAVKEQQLEGYKTEVDKLKQGPGLYLGGYKVPGTGAMGLGTQQNEERIKSVTKNMEALNEELYGKDGLYAGLEKSKNAAIEIDNRFRQVDDSFQRVTASAGSAGTTTEAAAAAMGVAGAKADDAGKKSKAAAVGIRDIDRALDQMRGHAADAGKALADVTFELEQAIRRSTGQILQADIEDARKQAENDIADISKLIKQAQIDYRELDQKLKGKRGATPEALAKLAEEQQRLNQVEKDGLAIKAKIAEKLGITIEQLEKVGEAQRNLNIAQLNEDYTQLTGTLEQQLQVQNQRLETELQLRLAQNKYLSDAERQLDIAIVKQQQYQNTLRATGSVVDGLQFGFSEMGRTMKTEFDIGMDLARDLSDAFSDFFDVLLDGSKSGKDAMEALFDGIKKAFSSAMSDMLQKQVMQPMLGGLFSPGTAAASTGGGLFSGLGGGGFLSGLGSLASTAGGGLFKMLPLLGMLTGNGSMGSMAGYLGGSALGYLAGPSLLGPALGALSPTLGPALGGLFGTGQSMLLGAFAGPIGMVLGGVLGSLLGGLFGEEEPPPAPVFGMKFGMGGKGQYYSSKYNFGSWTENFEENKLTPGPMQSQMKKYFEDTLDRWEKTFHLSAREVFEKYPQSMSFEVTEEMDVVRMAARKFIGAYGLAFANEILGIDYVQMFDKGGLTTGMTEDEAMTLIMGKEGKAARKAFQKYLTALKDGKEKRDETFERVMEYLDFFPDITDRLNAMLAETVINNKGKEVPKWTLADASAEIERQVEWFKENVMEGFQQALSSAIESADFSDFENAFSETIESVIVGGFDSVNMQAIQDAFLTTFTDPLLGVKDLIDQYFRGDIDSSGFQTGIGDLFEQFGSMYDEFAPVVDEFAAFREEFVKFVEDLLGITQTKYDNLTESLTDIIETAGMSSYEKQLRDLEQQKQDWIEQATKLGALENDPIWRLIEQAYQALFDQLQESSDSIKDVWSDMLDEIMDKYNDLKYSDLNVALPKEKAMEAALDYQKLFEAALGGDQTAISDFLAFTDQYLSLQQDVYKSSLAYQEIFASVMEDILRLQALAESKTGEGYAEGGIVTGPTSGYTATLHGTEAVIPLKNGSVPVEINGGSNQQPIYVEVRIGNELLDSHVRKEAGKLIVEVEKRGDARRGRAIS